MTEGSDKENKEEKDIFPIFHIFLNISKSNHETIVINCIFAEPILDCKYTINHILFHGYFLRNISKNYYFSEKNVPSFSDFAGNKGWGLG